MMEVDLEESDQSQEEDDQSQEEDDQSRAAIERDLKSYADQWRQLQEDEVEASYGPVFPKPTDLQNLCRKGTCILEVTLRRGTNCIMASWDGDSGLKFEPRGQRRVVLPPEGSVDISGYCYYIHNNPDLL